MSESPGRYWGGTLARDGKVRPLEATTFKELVESYINKPVIFSMTRPAFMAHPKRDTLKDTHFINCCVFKEGTELRNDISAKSLRLVILDLDEGEQVKHYYEAPETIGDQLTPYSCAVWATAKSTPENPRLKIVIPVKECDTKHLKALVKYLACDRLGLPADFKGVRESKVVSQPQYRPMKFQDEDFISVLFTKDDGVEVDIVDLPKKSDTEEEEFVYGYEDSIESALAFLPITELTVSDIEGPLRAIPSDCDYREWTQVCSSLRHQFRDEGSAREAFELFRDWSSESDKYKSGEPEAKWRSFKPDTQGKDPITIRSLFKISMGHGWENVKLAASFQERIEKWINACEDKKLLMEMGCRKIVENPFPNDIVTGYLVNALRARLKEIGGGTIDKKDILSELAKTRQRKRLEKTTTSLPKWLRPFCFIAPQNLFRNTATGMEYSPAAFDNCFSVELLSADPDNDAARSGRPAILPTHYALNQMKIRRVDGVIYDCRFGGGESFFKFEGKEFLNTFSTATWPVEDEENAEAAGALFTKHFENMIPEKEYREILLDFLCFIIQNPGVKIRWMPVIQSGEGVGKGILGKVLRAVMGNANVGVISPDLLQSVWSDWQINKQFYLLEEVHTPGQNREVVANRLKTFISDDVLTINKRNTTAFDWPNLSNAIAFTNFMDAFHMKESNRRLFVLSSHIQTKAQVEALEASGHFDRMDILKDEWAGALRHWMLNRKISESFKPNSSAPHTTYRQDVIESSKNSLQIEIEDLIAGPDELIGEDVIHESRLLAITEHAARNNHKPSHFLQVLGYTRYQGTRKFLIRGERTSIWTHRELFDEIWGSPEEILEQRAGKEKDL